VDIEFNNDHIIARVCCEKTTFFREKKTVCTISRREIKYYKIVLELRIKEYYNAIGSFSVSHEGRDY
jgi:hypothetical protein